MSIRSIAESVAESVERSVAESVERSVAESVAREVESAVGREVASTVSEALTREVGREIAEAVGREIGREVQSEVSRQIARAVAEVEGVALSGALSRALRRVGREVFEAIERNRRVLEEAGVLGGTVEETLHRVMNLLERAHEGDIEAIERLSKIIREVPQEDRSILARALHEYLHAQHISKLKKLVPLLGALATAGAILYASEPNRLWREYVKREEEFERELEKFAREKIKDEKLRREFLKFVKTVYEDYMWYSNYNRLQTPVGQIFGFAVMRYPSIHDVEKMWKIIEKYGNKLAQALKEGNREKAREIIQEYLREMSKIVNFKTLVGKPLSYLEYGRIVAFPKNHTYRYTAEYIPTLVDMYFNSLPNEIKKLYKEFVSARDEEKKFWLAMKIMDLIDEFGKLGNEIQRNVILRSIYLLKMYALDKIGKLPDIVDEVNNIYNKVVGWLTYMSHRHLRSSKGRTVYPVQNQVNQLFS